MIASPHYVAAAIGLCLAGAMGVRFLGARPRLADQLTLWVTLVAGLGAFAAALPVLIQGEISTATLWQSGFSWLAWRVAVDGLSAFFLVLIAVGTIVGALYAPGYLNHPHYRDCSRASYQANFLAFVAALYGLVTTTDMIWFFLVFWQLMTLPGYTLIRYERENPASTRAAARYLWMMQLACLLTLLGGALLVQGAVSVGNETLVPTDLDAVSHHLAALATASPIRVNLGLGFLLAGFGIKVGMWPFGPMWLPDAHPAAPAPFSAMLSGVMIKTGIYGLLRSFLTLIPPDAREFLPCTGWGVLIALLGTASLFIGTARALGQDQTKRLLAWSTIGQGGYILLALGVCVALVGLDLPGATALAGLALVACLFHTFNHSLFKSLLFLVAGSLFQRTGTQDLNRMGGLGQWMPWTAAVALVASLSIAGVPLTNGFASKWCLFVATFQSASFLPWLIPLGAIGVLTSALTLAVVLKLFGSAFLGRSPAAAEVIENSGHPLSRAQCAAQFVPAALCLLLGLAPALGLAAIVAVLQASPQGLIATMTPLLPVSGTLAGGLVSPAGGAALNPLLLVALAAVLLFATAWVLRRVHAPRRRTEPWLCGYAGGLVSRYPARHFCAPMRNWLPARNRGPRPAAPSAPILQPLPGDLADPNLQGTTSTPP